MKEFTRITERADPGAPKSPEPWSADVYVLPASAAQRRFWLVQLLSPESPALNSPIGFRVRGPVDLRALETAYNELIDRHEILRSVLSVHEGTLCQIVAPELWCPLEIHDLRQGDPADREAQADAIVVETVNRPFRLDTGPLHRFLVIQIRDDELILLLNFHHSITDGWSVSLFLEWLKRHYENALSPEPKTLETPPLQYGDYAEWERAFIERPEQQQALAYWREKLRGAEVLHLQPDRPRRGPRGQKGAYASVLLPKSLSDRVRQVVGREDATMFMVMLAAFDVLLFRYSGQTDISVGSPVAGRHSAEVERLLGCFINTLVFRCDLGGNPTFRELLRRVKSVALDAYAHQTYPFERIVEELKPERSGGSPFFNVTFSCQKDFVPAFEIAGAVCSPLAVVERIAGALFDLTLLVVEKAEGIRCVLEFDTEVFDQVTAERTLEHFRSVLEAIADDPSVRIGEIDFLTPSERHLLTDWMWTRVAIPEHQRIDELIEDQARKTPDGLAVTCGGERVTYRDLVARANQLAAHLVDLGVACDDLVGVALERSADLIVAILGVLKAGGAYVPLDPTYPSDRLRFQIEDSGIHAIVTTATLTARLPQTGIRRVLLDDDQLQIRTYPSTPPEGVRTSLAARAYVIYTSGSTGTPKGVMVTHRNLLHSTLARLQYYREPVSRFLMVSPVAFDSSVAGVFWTLCSGGTLVLPAEGEQKDLVALEGLIDRESVSHLLCVPSLWAALLAERRTESMVSLQTVIVAGEACPMALVERHYGQMGTVALFNEYGPTETTVWCTVERLTRTDESTQVAIGRPIANTRAYILDSAFRPVPIGKPGLLYIGGAGVARGYLGRPELTAERFIPDPFSDNAGERLYATGDIARFRADGRIDYLGRSDSQVKLRGFRVELGEIESAIRNCVGVEDAAVQVWTPASGTERLVAYVVSSRQWTPADLKASLASRLPEHMVPAAFVRLGGLPKLPNGKLDRLALPPPTWEEEHAGLASSPTEVNLMRIWADVLGTALGVDDDFFDAGGHSLAAAQVRSRVLHDLHVDLPLRTFFEKPTVRALATEVDQAARMHADRQAIPALHLRQGELSFAQRRLWFLNRFDPSSVAYNIPEGFRLRGPLMVSALQLSLNEIVHRHETLRTAIVVQNGRPILEVRDRPDFAVPAEEGVTVPAEERDAYVTDLLQAEARRPFDLETGQPVRFRLVRFSDDDHVLVVTFHHIITDEWSTGVFCRELSRLYDTFARGQRSALPPLPIQYSDYAAWQRAQFEAGAFQAQLEYWKVQLAHPPVIELPTDKPRPDVYTEAGANLDFRLSDEISEKLRALSREEGVTLYMTLLAGFALLLGRYTRLDDIVVGTPVSGRNRVETEDLIGVFLNTLVLRTSLSGKPTFRDVIRRVRETALNAFAHADVPFEKLVEQLQPERAMNQTPLFQIMFTAHDESGRKADLPGLQVDTLSVSPNTAKFDLSLGFLLDPQDRSRTPITGAFNYRTDLFLPSTIERLSRHLTTLLDVLANHPDHVASLLSMLSPAEREQVVVEWNRTEQHFATPVCLHELFERHAAETPDAIAVVGDSHEWTYREVNLRANQVANYLQRQRVGPDAIVGICMDRSAELLAAILGVLKAGGAYLPLDPAYPPERLGFMMTDAKVVAVITHHDVSDRLPRTKHPTLVLDADWSTLETESAAEPVRTARPEHLAYVIYTSGSTGTPKGVMTEHRAIVDHLLWSQSVFPLRPGDAVLERIATSFDASVWNIFAPLIAGARVVMCGPAAQSDPDELVRLIRDHQVTSFLEVPSVLRMLLDVPALMKCRSIRLIFSGGEALNAELHDRVRASLDAQFCNLYGPTEAAIFSSFYPCVHRRENGAVPIGRPVGNTQIYVVDPHLNAVPIGVPGELCVSGNGLGRGYVGRPDLTADAFVPNPFASDGARLYRTGDLVRYREDGNIEFLGRIDQQLKIRGLRIEPAEIESELAKLPGVKEAAVNVWGPATSRKLVAFVVPSGQTLELAEVRAVLRTKLPSHMIPAMFEIVPALPRMPNGKIDRHALTPHPQRQGGEGEASRRPNSVELGLVDIWERILGIHPIGVRDNFFDLGGHSLLAVELMQEVRRHTGRELPLATLFKAPTIEQMADLLEQEQWRPSPDSLVPIKSTGNKPPFYCVHGAGGNVVQFGGLARFLSVDQPMYGLQSQGLDKGKPVHTRIENMASHYIEEIRRFQPEGPYLIGGSCFGGLVAYEMARQMTAQGMQVDLVALLDSFASDFSLKSRLSLHLGRLSTALSEHKRRIDELPVRRRASYVRAHGLSMGRYVLKLVTSRGRRMFRRVNEKAQKARKAIGGEVRQSSFQAFRRQNEVAAINYTPVPFEGKVVLFRGTRIPIKLLADRYNGWDRLARGGVEVHEVPGGHQTMLDEPNVRVLADKLQACIDTILEQRAHQKKR